MSEFNGQKPTKCYIIKQMCGKIVVEKSELLEESASADELYGDADFIFQ